jgi:hypothetical protein
MQIHNYVDFKNSREVYLVLVSLIFFEIFFFIFTFDGFDFYDDLGYSRAAYELSQGNWHYITQHFSYHRLALVVPLSAIYLLFDVHDWSTVLYPALCIIGMLVLLYSHLIPKDHSLTAWAILLLGLDFYTLFFGRKLYPDTLVAFYGFLFLVQLYHRDSRSPLLCSLILFLAFLSKETVIYLFLFIFLIMVEDFRKAKNQRFWSQFVIFSVFLLVVYLCCYQYFFGDAFLRFRSIQTEHHQPEYTYYDKSWMIQLKRLSYEPYTMLINTSLIITFVGAFLSFFQLMKNRFYLKDPLEDYWTKAALLSWLMFCFWSTNLQYYNPTFLMPRMILLLVPIFAIVSAFQLKKLFVSHTVVFYYAISFGLIALIAYQTLGNNGMVLIYGLLSTYFIIVGLFKKYLINKKTLVYTSFLMILLIHPGYLFLKKGNKGYMQEKNIVNNHLKNLPIGSVIYADDQFLNGYLYYFQFKAPTNLVFKSFSDWKGDESMNKNQYLLKNDFTIDYLKLVGKKMPMFLDSLDPEWQITVDEGMVKLYRLEKKTTFDANKYIKQ